jgi:glycosyltransferase involved in cell wall biosynthesis
MADRIRVAHLVPSLRRCGPVNVVMEVVSNTDAEDVAYEILYLDAPVELCPPCPHEPFSLGRPGALKRFDVVHTHCIRPEFYALASKVVSHGSYKLVTTIHGTSDEDYAFQFGKWRAWWIIRAEAVMWRAFSARLALGRHAAEHYRRSLGVLRHSEFDVVSNGFRPPSLAQRDPAVVGQIQGIEQGRVGIGICAGLINRKGIEQVVRVLVQEPRFHLFLLGDGPEKESLRRLALDLRVESRVVFLGFVPYPYVYAREFDVYCLPSRSEGQPMALIEGMAFGANVACSDIPVHRDMFDESEVSFFRLDDPQSLRAAIWSAVAAEPQRREAAVRAFSSRFDAPMMTRKYEAIYRRVCGLP